MDGNYEICLKFFLNPSMTMDGNVEGRRNRGEKSEWGNGGRVMEFFTRAMVVRRRASWPRKRENERKREGDERRRKRKRDKRTRKEAEA